MKLSVNCIQQILTLRNQRPPATYDAIADRFSLPRHLVALVIKHYKRLAYHINREAVEIPETGEGLWECPECGARLEFAPCVKCGPVGVVPRQLPAVRVKRQRSGERALPIVESRGYELMASLSQAEW